MTFRFSIAKNTGVFVCAHVWDHAQPILFVTNDCGGDWQFLCGAEHSGAEAKLVCLEDVVMRDESLNELAELRHGHSASRTAPSDSWVIVDEYEETVRRNIDEHGWHVAIVPGDADQPGFAYSIGMTVTLAHPEIIVFGLPGEVMHFMINDIGKRVDAGEHFEPRSSLDELLEGATCELHRVAKRHLRKYFGYACWFYKGDNFQALQCFWPGKGEGLFPWEPGCDDLVRGHQPILRD